MVVTRSRGQSQGPAPQSTNSNTTSLSNPSNKRPRSRSPSPAGSGVGLGAQDEDQDQDGDEDQPPLKRRTRTTGSTTGSMPGPATGDGFVYRAPTQPTQTTAPTTQTTQVRPRVMARRSRAWTGRAPGRAARTTGAAPRAAAAAALRWEEEQEQQQEIGMDTLDTTLDTIDSTMDDTYVEDDDTYEEPIRSRGSKGKGKAVARYHEEEAEAEEDKEPTPPEDDDEQDTSSISEPENESEFQGWGVTDPQYSDNDNDNSHSNSSDNDNNGGDYDKYNYDKYNYDNYDNSGSTESNTVINLSSDDDGEIVKWDEDSDYIYKSPQNSPRSYSPEDTTNDSSREQYDNHGDGHGDGDGDNRNDELSDEVRETSPWVDRSYDRDEESDYHAQQQQQQIDDSNDMPDYQSNEQEAESTGNVSVQTISSTMSETVNNDDSEHQEQIPDTSAEAINSQNPQNQPASPPQQPTPQFINPFLRTSSGHGWQDTDATNPIIATLRATAIQQNPDNPQQDARSASTPTISERWKQAQAATRASISNPIWRYRDQDHQEQNLDRGMMGNSNTGEPFNQDRIQPPRSVRYHYHNHRQNTHQPTRVTTTVNRSAFKSPQTSMFEGNDGMLPDLSAFAGRSGQSRSGNSGSSHSSRSTRNSRSSRSPPPPINTNRPRPATQSRRNLRESSWPALPKPHSSTRSPSAPLDENNRNQHWDMHNQAPVSPRSNPLTGSEREEYERWLQQTLGEGTSDPNHGNRGNQPGQEYDAEEEEGDPEAVLEAEDQYKFAVNRLFNLLPEDNPGFMLVMNNMAHQMNIVQNRIADNMRYNRRRAERREEEGWKREFEGLKDLIMGVNQRIEDTRNELRRDVSRIVREELEKRL